MMDPVDDSRKPPSTDTDSDTGTGGLHGLRLVLLTGMSGAGRSTAARALEDMGWFVIDNIPPSLLDDAIALARRTPDVDRVAVVLDARGGSFFPQISDELAGLPRKGIDIRTVFLEASDEALVRRFESSRRPHPLQQSGDGGRILDGLIAERTLLGDLRASADMVIDTTTINVHELRRRMEETFAADEPPVLQCTVMSFGFKYGIPVDADIVADARFLPNPYWDEALRSFSGLDEPVYADVLSRPGAQDFVATLSRMLEIVSEGYVREGKRFVTVAVGCTGGRHRSVSIARALAAQIADGGIEVGILHRDLGRE